MKRGKSVPVIVEEDVLIFFYYGKLNYLKNSLTNGDFKHIEISYIADAILLSGSVKFEDDAIIDAVELLVIDSLC